jgi:hypothetical protein
MKAIDSKLPFEWDLTDKYLRLKTKSIRKLISLPPKYLNNLNKGIEEAILKSNEQNFKEYKPYFYNVL